MEKGAINNLLKLNYSVGPRRGRPGLPVIKRPYYIYKNHYPQLLKSNHEIPFHPHTLPDRFAGNDHKPYISLIGCPIVVQNEGSADLVT